MKLLAKCTAIGAALVLVSSPASATVASWTYSVSSSFTYATYSDGSGGAIPSGADSLSWGEPIAPFGPQSSLTIGSNPATGSVTTYLGVNPPQTVPWLGLSTSLTHSNNEIYAPSLTSAVMTNTVTLNASSGGSDVQIVPFTIAFTETNNAGTCAATSPSGNPCNDIFVLTGGLTNFSFTFDDDDPDAIADTYYVNIFPTTGGVLSTLQPSACAAAGRPSGCIGFTTPEGGDTTLAFGFTISTNPLQVPEPGILALFGIGLMGLFVRRRRGS